MTTTKLYNSFISLSFQKKSELIQFLSNHQDNTELNQSTIRHLVDYALKEFSSFGGFVVTEEEEDKKIIGAMVVNNTGMEGYMPNNLVVASAFLPGTGKAGSKKRILQRILYLTKGDTALLVKTTCKKEIPQNIGIKTIQFKR